MIVICLTLPGNQKAAFEHLQGLCSARAGWELSGNLPPMIPLFSLSGVPSRGQMLRAAKYPSPRFTLGPLRVVPSRLGLAYQLEFAIAGFSQGDCNAQQILDRLLSLEDSALYQSAEVLRPRLFTSVGEGREVGGSSGQAGGSGYSNGPRRTSSVSEEAGGSGRPEISNSNEESSLTPSLVIGLGDHPEGLEDIIEKNPGDYGVPDTLSSPSLALLSLEVDQQPNSITLNWQIPMELRLPKGRKNT